MFAIIETGGKQYKVAKGDKLEVELVEAKEGSTFNIEKVLLIAEGSKINIGTPFIEGAYVQAKFIANAKADKVRVYKMKAKKRYQKSYGHRQNYSQIEIVEIKESGAKTKETQTKEVKETKKPATPAKKPAAKKKSAPKA